MPHFNNHPSEHAAFVSYKSSVLPPCLLCFLIRRLYTIPVESPLDYLTLNRLDISIAFADQAEQSITVSVFLSCIGVGYVLLSCAFSSTTLSLGVASVLPLLASTVCYACPLGSIKDPYVSCRFAQNRASAPRV